MKKRLNVVSLNIPWPPNYGGVIDIYYKIRALHEAGAGVTLHCFEYERPRARQLEDVCDEVFYYRRRTGIASNLSLLPYNVCSRRDSRLVDNLLANDYPILFEGLHTCYYMNDKRLGGRFKIFRACNIEHDYYRATGRAESNLLKKCFFYLEGWRFERYQPAVAAANLMLAVSQADTDCLKRAFPYGRVEWTPCFHGHRDVTSIAGSSDFMLYHGKLSVKENEVAALFLIDHVFSRLAPCRCIIAGMNPSERILQAAARRDNVIVEANPPLERIDELVRTAHINILPTFQDTGLKLKLLNSLFAGRHVVVNTMMLAGSGLDKLCHVADDAADMAALCRRLMETPFSADDVDKRRNLLFPAFSDRYHAEKLIAQLP